ncbi:hypothetical protein HYZ98_04515 [Candidatus Peregrinibacteria bacterium]|nr:hypothetical protein [Candidatus Peregrinibacteria bacterium]
MEYPTKIQSPASIARTTPIDLNKRLEAALLLALSPTPQNTTSIRDFHETIRLRYRADIFATLIRQLMQSYGIPNGIATIDQMELLLSQLAISHRNIAIMLDDSDWRKVVKETKHDLVATAIETMQESVHSRDGKLFSETTVGMIFSSILQDLSHPEDTEEEDFL